MSWELFDRKIKTYQSQQFFHERWVHRESKSGMVFYSDLDKEGKIKYVVEGYGTGTVDPDTFKEITEIAPIQRREFLDLEDAKRALKKLQRSIVNK